MASIQRMIKSGFRLYNYKPRGINFTASPVSANSYRSLCSSSSGDGSSILSNVKRSSNVHTLATVNASKAEGIPPAYLTQVLAKLEKDHILIDKQIVSLRKNILIDKQIDKEAKALKKEIEDLWGFFAFGSFAILGLVVLVVADHYEEIKKLKAKQ